MWDRSNKETCSDRCRKAWSRRKKHVHTAAIDAHWAIMRLRGMLKDYPELQSLIHQELRNLRTDIHDAFVAYPDEETKLRMQMLNDRALKRDAG